MLYIILKEERKKVILYKDEKNIVWFNSACEKPVSFHFKKFSNHSCMPSQLNFLH